MAIHFKKLIMPLLLKGNALKLCALLVTALFVHPIRHCSAYFENLQVLKPCNNGVFYKQLKMLLETLH